ncbi:hypothetical protein DUI87_30371 [Hirundo rustica rustica]|uniref:ribonuclease H n=1 Tax=Hirundo rustica rustica TaxID=333673 RepID=A0A3M0J359_HIRRU|nr:hypothetical protein DUI87_30371 [Hirundo rustica rustica]
MPVPQPSWQGAQPPKPQAPLIDSSSPELELASFLSPAAQVPQNPLEARHTPPTRRTRRQLKRLNEVESENEGERNNLFPLREVPTTPGIIGYVNVPINTSDVRPFKEEMGKLMDDPLGVSERLDEFLGTSIYSYEDLTAILRSLFNTKEREVIRQAGMREWERRNPQSTPGDQKWPSQDPRWNAQTEEVKDSRLIVSLYKLTLEDEKEINQKVWHTGREAGKLDIEPISIEIERPEDPIRVKQYPITLEGRRGLKPIIEDLIAKGILEPCMYRHNTPILAIRKTDGSYRLVQDLRAVNERTKTRFPVVANPYTLLNRVSPEDIWYSVIDLKDAFWTCPLAEGSQDYFAFQREDPDTNRKQQLRWAFLPQGFVDSPNLFGQALEQLLSQFSPGEGTKILQYIDDLLIAGQEEGKVRACTISLLNFLGEKGLKVSKSKLQFTEPEVKYLGHWITKGRKRLDPERVAGIIELPPRRNKRQVRQLLGLLGYCRQWIEGYSKKVKFLYEKLTTDKLKWTEQDERELKHVKEALIAAPVLSLPDVKKKFQLFIDASNHTAHGVLTQDWAGDKKTCRLYL